MTVPAPADPVTEPPIVPHEVVVDVVALAVRMTVSGDAGPRDVELAQSKLRTAIARIRKVLNETDAQIALQHPGITVTLDAVFPDDTASTHR